MKITKIILLLFAFLCTSNVWAQLNEKGQQNFTSENRVIKDMKIQVSTSGWKRLCTDYDQGILLLGENYIERTSEIDVYPGGVLTIRAYRDGMGDTNVVLLTIPEDAIDPTLVITGTASTHFPLYAHFSGH